MGGEEKQDHSKDGIETSENRSRNDPIVIGPGKRKSTSVINGKGKEPEIIENHTSDQRLLTLSSSSSSSSSSTEIRSFMDEQTKAEDSKFEEKEPKNKEEEIEKPPTSIVCEICMDTITEAEMFRSNDCSHHESYCHVCIGKHVVAKIKQNIIEVKCPESGCNTLLEPQNCAPFVPRQVLERWEAALRESAFDDEDELLEEDETSAACLPFYWLFCAMCQPSRESRRTQNQKADDETDEVDEEVMRLAKIVQWTKCPKCRFYVERIEVCPQIRCR
ncbi:E3 ubiquitin ligase RBR family [Parasponia andersonii]|uniref:E3 ubiquitin ligase RBR family n=1 Tax=Parasponia andersonii TaxID=3476 RepID=A0A2P5B8H5_PARAD|nr:E3 ubiquitin ligase RBR family [Parasponia andersonii]